MVRRKLTRDAPNSTRRVESRARVPPSRPTMSDERTHKAHHPSQSGKKAERNAKGKERHNTSNDKVATWSFFLVCQAPHAHLLRRLHPDQAGEQKDRVVVQQSKLKLAFMFHSSTVPPVMPPHQS